MERQMVEGGAVSSKSNQLQSKQCIACNKLLNSQVGFESHLAGRKHAKQLLKRTTHAKIQSDVKDDSKKCENADEKMLSTDSGLVVKDNMEKRLEKELVEKVKYNEDLASKEEKIGMQENAELNEQRQTMIGAMPLKLCNRPSNLSKLSIKNCSNVKGDEQRSFEKPAWKAKDDKDLGATINQVNIEEIAELIDQYQMEGNSKQQKVQIEQQMPEGNSKKQIPQMEQQMMEGGTLSLQSNQLQSKQCIACNKLFNSQAGFESHLAGRKHAKQLLKRITHVEIQSDVKDDSKKCENASEKILSIDSGLVVKDNMEKRLEKELVEKVKYNEDLVSKEEKIGMPENEELNEQQQIMIGAMPLKLCNRSSKLSKLSIKNCSYVNGDEQRSLEKPTWNAKDDKDLGATINQVNIEEIAELIHQHQMEGNLKQQQVQIEQQMPEGNSKKQNPQMEQQMMEGGTLLLKSNQSRTEECVACNTVINSQDDFESHLAGRKYAEKSLQRITHAKALSEVRDDRNHCENAGEKILISIDSRLVVKDNVEKRMELVEKVKYNGDLVAKENEVGMKGNAELNEQQQIMVGAMPFKSCKWSSNLSELNIKKCKISYVKCDEQKSSENKHVWKAKVDNDLGAKINEVDMKGKLELIDQHEMKEGNSKQQNVQIEQQMAGSGSEQQMMETRTPSLKSNQLRTEEFLTCNKVSMSQKDFESHLSGRKHGKQLLQRMTCSKVQSKFKDDSKKCENAGEKLLISIDSGLIVMDNVDNRLEKELDEKVKYNGVLVAKEDRVGMKGNMILNEQQQMMVGAMPSKVCKKSSNLSDLSIKNCNISDVKGDEQKTAENKPVWKPKDDKYLGAKINKIDMKKNVELIDQDQMKEGNSKQQKVQIEQQMIEDNSKQKNPQMEQQMMQGGASSLQSNQLRTGECVSCNKVFNSQDDFESRLAGRKHAKQLLQTIKCVKAVSEVKDDSMKCANAGENILISTDSGLLVKDNIKKRLEKEHVEKVIYDGVLFAKEEKVGLKENAELNEQQQIMLGSLPSKLCKTSSNLNELNIKDWKISYVKCDEQKSYENKPVWKAKHDKDLGAKMNEADMKKNVELIDQHQMKAGNSKQQNVQIEQQMTEGNLRQQYPHMEQQMIQGGTPSLKSNQLRTEVCVTCNNVFNSQDDFETHLAGRKHAKELLQTIKCVDALSEVKDNSKKYENAGEKILISTDSGLLFIENMEKRLEKELVEKVKYDAVLVAKEEKVSVKENGELNEQPQIMVGSLPSKLCKRSSNLNKLSINNCKISYIKCDEQRSYENKPVWKAKDNKDLGAKFNEVDLKENTEFIDQHQMKEGNSKEQKVQIEQQLIEGNSKQQKSQMDQKMMEEGTTFEEYVGSPNSNPLRFKEFVTCNIALKIPGVFEAHLSGRKHAKQSKEVKTKVVWKVADDSDLNTKSNKDGIKEMDEHELEQMNTRGVSSKVCKMPSNARQLNIEECSISKENDDVNRSDINKLVWKVQDDRNLDTKRNKVDTEGSTELNEQCLIKEGDSEQQNFQSEQKMKEGKSKQQKFQMEQQMEGVSKTQKLQMKQEIMENGLKSKQHEGCSEQLKVNEYVICNTVLNFYGDSEAEFARRKHAKQLKKMENKTVWKVTDKRHLCSKSGKFLLNETTGPSEKQHMKGTGETAELSDKQHMEGMKETAELSEKQHMKEDCMPSKICKNSSNASQLSIDEFKIPITKHKVDKGAINQSVRRVNEQQWMRKTNMKRQKL